MTLVGKLFNSTPNHIPRNTLEEAYGLPIIIVVQTFFKFKLVRYIIINNINTSFYYYLSRR